MAASDESRKAIPRANVADTLRGIVARALDWTATPRGMRTLLWGSIAILPVITAAVWLSFRELDITSLTVDDALRLLDEGEFGKARYVANRLIATEALPDSERGGPLFVQGASIILESESYWEDDRRRRGLEAAAFLNLARDYGFPRGREGEGLFYLGRGLYEGGLLEEGREALRESLEFHPRHSTEVHRILAKSYLVDAHPDLPLALDHNTQYLASEGLTESDRQAALLQRAQILLAMNRLMESREVINQLGVEARRLPAAELLNSRLAIMETDDAATLSQVLENLSKLQTADPPISRQNSESRYLIAVCLRKMGRHAEALAHFEATARDFSAFPEAIVAALEAGEVAVDEGRYERSAELFRLSLRTAPPPRRFSNPWITLEQFQARLLEAHHRLVEAGAFQPAIDLAQGLDRVFPPVVAELRLATTHRAWAEHAGGGGIANADTMASDESIRLWRETGRAYARLAETRFTTDDFLDDAWQSAEAFRRAGEPAEALRMYSQYIEYDSRLQRPQALIRLAESLLELGQSEAALRTVDQFLAEYPNHVAVYEARMVAAEAHQAAGDLGKAREFFIQNVNDPKLQPESFEWRGSLMSLCRVLYAEGVSSYMAALRIPPGPRIGERLNALEEATDRLQVAVRRLREYRDRYDQIPGMALTTMEAEYLMADALWKIARYPKERAENVTVESTRLRLRNEVRDALRSAADGYDAVQRRLHKILDDRQPLTVDYQSMLRNCYFARGAVLFELGDYEQAAQAYAAAANRYQHRPESLDAFLQMAACQRHLGLDADALSTLQQARIVLGGLPAEVRCEESTNFTREEWQKEIDWLIEKYRGTLVATAGR